MYLLTFAFLIIGLLGIYTQVLAVQTARLAASQTSIAQAMTAWHGAAVSLASNVVSPMPASGNSCSLTASYTAVSYCPTGSHVTVNSPAPNTVVTGSYSFGGNSYPHLPPTYNTAVYQWNSILYNNGGRYYVVTFVATPATASSYISTAAGTQITYAQSDIYQQIQQSGLSILNYGYVNSAGTLVTPASTNGVPYVYSGVPVPAGSLAIISNASQCNGC